MFTNSFLLKTRALTLALVFIALPLSLQTDAQRRAERELKPNLQLALGKRAAGPSDISARQGGYQPLRAKRSLPARDKTASAQSTRSRRKEPARVIVRRDDKQSLNPSGADATSHAASLPPISPGTSLAYVLHTSQLSNISGAGSVEQFLDQNLDLEADARTTFDNDGGAFDLAVGRSGARYEVFSAIDDRGTSNTGDDIPVGVLVVALDTNGNFTRDSSATFDLERDFKLPSAVSVVSGASLDGREFVVISSSGYYNFDNPNDPDNEPSAGVVLLVRDPLTGGFDNSRSRELVRVGSNQLNNANALTLLPNNDLLIADFDSNELRVVRDTNGDRLPDTLDPVPFYSYQFSDDAPLDIAANSRGVVFSHSQGDDAVMLAVYDDNSDGRADGDEVVVEGLSLDNNLVLHGLTVDREGTVYVIEDASGSADTSSSGGNGGEPRVDAFPDPALNGLLRDGAIYTFADNPSTQSLAGLAFGFDASLGSVGRLTFENSASQRAPATRDGLASIFGSGLTFGLSGATQAAATANGVRVTIEGRNVPVFSFGDSQINVHVPAGVALDANSVVVSVEGNVTAADDATIAVANPGLFTLSQTGAGEAVALLVSGNRYTSGAFPTKFNGQPSVIALFGTGWRNSLPLTVTIGGRPATVQYAGASGGFPGLDQINVAIPDGTPSGTASVIVTTANGAASRNDVFVRIQ